MVVAAVCLGGCAVPTRSTDKLPLDASAVLGNARSSVVQGAAELADTREALRLALERLQPVPPAVPALPAVDPLGSKPISMSMQGARIGQLLWILATEYGLSLAIDPSVLEMPHTVNLYLQKVTGTQALAHILDSFDVHGHLGEDKVLVVSRTQERIFYLGNLLGSSVLEMSNGGDTFGGAKDGGGGMKSVLSIKSEAGDKANAVDNLIKTIDAAVADAPATAADGKDKARVTVNRSSGTLYVRARPSVVRSIEKLVKQEVSFRQRQIQIDAQLIDVQLNDESQFGVDWSLFKGRVLGRFGGAPIGIGGGSGTLADGLLPGNRGLSIPSQSIGDGAGLGLGFGNHAFSVAINALKTFGAVRVLSNPSLLVRNGMPAYMNVGTSIRYIQKVTSQTSLTAGGQASSIDVTTDSIFSGLVVGVSAVVKEDGAIELFINPSQNEVQAASLALVNAGGGNMVTLPVVNTKTLATTLNMRSGDTVVIGGLIDKQTGGRVSGVPGLSDIPTLGRAFSTDSDKDSTRELVIVLRAQVL